MPDESPRYVLCLKNGERVFCLVLTPGSPTSRVSYTRSTRLAGKLQTIIEWHNNSKIYDTWFECAYTPPNYAASDKEAA